MANKPGTGLKRCKKCGALLTTGIIKVGRMWCPRCKKYMKPA